MSPVSRMQDCRMKKETITNPRIKSFTSSANLSSMDGLIFLAAVVERLQSISGRSQKWSGARNRAEPQATSRCHLSGIDYLEITDEKRPLLVGERTNVIGSRRFKRLIAEGSLEEASEIGRKQVRNGAHIIDVCLANPDREEREDMDTFLSQLIKKVRIPLMIDSTDAEVIELALQYSQGKGIINSINLEDGEERFAQVVPLARKYGAALIVGCIDDDPVQGMATTVERKLEVARRSYDLLTQKVPGSSSRFVFRPACVSLCHWRRELYRIGRTDYFGRQGDQGSVSPE